MAAIKLESPKETVYADVPFLKHFNFKPVSLLNQGSAADILLGMFRLFSVKQFHKNTSERLIGKGVYLFSNPNHCCFGRATAEE